MNILHLMENTLYMRFFIANMNKIMFFIILLFVSISLFSQNVQYKNYAIEDINIMEQYVNDTLTGFVVDYNLNDVRISATNRNQWNLNETDKFMCIAYFDKNITVFNTYTTILFEQYLYEFRLKDNEVDIIVNLYKKLKDNE